VRAAPPPRPSRCFGRRRARAFRRDHRPQRGRRAAAGHRRLSRHIHSPVFYFRIAVPKHQRDKLKKTEIRRSLKTRDLRTQGDRIKKSFIIQMDGSATIANNALQNMLLLRKCMNVLASASNLQNFNAIALSPHCITSSTSDGSRDGRGRTRRYQDSDRS
jgi:hypothetical protein